MASIPFLLLNHNQHRQGDSKASSNGNKNVIWTRRFRDEDARIRPGDDDGEAERRENNAGVGECWALGNWIDIVWLWPAFDDCWWCWKQPLAKFFIGKVEESGYGKVHRASCPSTLTVPSAFVQLEAFVGHNWEWAALEGWPFNATNWLSSWQRPVVFVL